MLLIRRQSLRLSKRDDNDRRLAPIKFTFERFHLAEVVLARQSSEVSKKNEQGIFSKIILEVNRSAPKVKQLQLTDRDLIHGPKPIAAGRGALVNRPAISRRMKSKKGRSDPTPLLV